jgi:hypothetical protein
MLSVQGTNKLRTQLNSPHHESHKLPLLVTSSRNMHPTPLPLDIEYLVLEDLSYLGDDPTLDEYKTILSCLRVCCKRPAPH